MPFLMPVLKLLLHRDANDIDCSRKDNKRERNSGDMSTYVYVVGVSEAEKYII